MNNYSVFDILGPVMIGPSSSHTAGACRLGKVASEINKIEFDTVVFFLHGSFAKTYMGHGTDRALVAGVMGMEAQDERIKDSLNLAAQQNINIKFEEADLGYEHPNTVKILFKNTEGEEFFVIGSSIGGGSILITNINGDEVELTGEYPVLIIKHQDKKGMISRISFELAMNEINIATLKVNREKKGYIAITVVETDSVIHEPILKELEKLEGIISVTKIEKI